MQLKEKKMERVEELEDLWEMIPSMRCKEGCTDCCDRGVTPSQTYLERKKISEWFKARGWKEPETESPFDPCPYIKNGRCSIHEVRPIPCRLFGVVETVKCPHGYGPAQCLTETEAREIIMLLAELNEKSLTCK